MADNPSLIVTVAVEGNLDQAVMQRLVEDAGGALGPVHGRRGKQYLRERLAGFNNAAKFSPWVVLVDLDEDAECAARLRDEWLPNPTAGMLFRVAVREIEAWLLGDAERLSRFLGVRRADIHGNPETIVDAKQIMVSLGRSSKRREIREDLVPRPGSGRTVGSAYSSRLAAFVLNKDYGWRPEVAARICDSLARLINRLSQVKKTG